jgi:hypothetical protein
MAKPKPGPVRSAIASEFVVENDRTTIRPRAHLKIHPQKYVGALPAFSGAVYGY